MSHQGDARTFQVWDRRFPHLPPESEVHHRCRRPKASSTRLTLRLAPLVAGGLFLASGCDSYTSPFVWEPDENGEEDVWPVEVGIREYEVVPLELPPGMEGRGTDLHASGQAVGYVRTGPDGVQEGVRWDASELVDRWTLDGWHIEPAALNGSGEVVANVAARDARRCTYGAFLESEGMVVRFTGPEPDPQSEQGCDTLVVRDLDEHGRVVGDWRQNRRYAFAYLDGRMVHLFRRDEDGGSPPSPEVFGMNDRGLVVGWVRPLAYHTPFHWRLDGLEEGADSLAGTFLSSGWSRTGRAVGVNDEGTVMVGWGIQAGDSQSLYHLESGERTDLFVHHEDVSFLPSAIRFADINNRGEIVGNLGAAISRPFYLSPSLDPYYLEDARGQWVIGELIAIDDRGWILAEALGGDGLRPRPVLLVPAEEG